MIDRPKALIAGLAALCVAALLVTVGYIAGKSGNDDTTDNDPTPALDGDGLPAGPTGLEGGMPVGFAHSEEGARAAALSWMPWFLSSPSGEWPDGADGVLADGVTTPVDESLSRRLQFAPIGSKIDMDSEDRATVTVLGMLMEGSAGAEVSGEMLKVPVVLAWDAAASDWRITSFPSELAGDVIIDGPLDAADVEGFEAVRAAGVVPGSALVEEVPGE